MSFSSKCYNLDIEKLLKQTKKWHKHCNLWHKVGTALEAGKGGGIGVYGRDLYIEEAQRQFVHIFRPFFGHSSGHS